MTYWRCPEWSPGGELKCELGCGHEGSCKAHRIGPMAKGAVIMWNRARIVRALKEE